MLKKVNVTVLLAFLILLPTNAFAGVLSQTGSVFINQAFYDAGNDVYRVDLNPAIIQGGSVHHRLYNNSDFSTPTWDSKHYFSWNIEWAYATYTCRKYIYDVFYDVNGNKVGEVKIYADQIVNDRCKTTYTPDVSDKPVPNPNPGGCAPNCDLFKCPGWQEHMSKLDEIIGKIPPPPNWQDVAGIFRDTIAPQIKKDIQDILGEVDDPPAPPPRPSTPPIGKDLDNRDLKDPEGKNADGLKDSGFTDNDIKDKAPKIPVRNDPTGGFKINNPIDNLPSQDEFIKQKPAEGTAPLPGDPEEQENKAPSPSEGENQAPIPNEGSNTPPNPNEGNNQAPLPDESGTAPLPNESGTAPIPNENWRAPLP